MHCLFPLPACAGKPWCYAGCGFPQAMPVSSSPLCAELPGVRLAAGNHTVRLTMATAGFNVNWLDMAYQSR